jgi:hypothetical protein
MRTLLSSRIVSYAVLQINTCIPHFLKGVVKVSFSTTIGPSVSPDVRVKTLSVVMSTPPNDVLGAIPFSP